MASSVALMGAWLAGCAPYPEVVEVQEDPPAPPSAWSQPPEPQVAPQPSSATSAPTSSATSPADGNPPGTSAQVYGYTGYSSECVPCVHPKLATEMKVTAASELPKYPIGHAFDRDDATAWCEAEEGPGVGAWIRMELDPPRDIAELEILGGDFSSDEVLFAGPRVKRLRVESDTGKTATFELLEPPRRFKVSMLTGMHPYLPLDWTRVSTVTVTIEDVYPGDKTETGCMTYVALWVAPTEPVQ